MKITFLLSLEANTVSDLSDLLTLLRTKLIDLIARMATMPAELASAKAEIVRLSEKLLDAQRSLAESLSHGVADDETIRLANEAIATTTAELAVARQKLVDSEAIVTEHDTLVAATQALIAQIDATAPV